MSSNGGALGTGSASQEVEDFTVHEIDKDANDRKESSTDPSVIAEKGEVVHVTKTTTMTDTCSFHTRSSSQSTQMRRKRPINSPYALFSSAVA